MTTDPTTHLFWITSRAAGTTALVLSSLSVGYGLAMAGRLRLRASRSGALAVRRTIHEALAISVMAALAVHGLALLGDAYLHPSVLDVTVPFAMSYHRAWTAIGIASGWAIVLLGLSFYARRRIGASRFKIIHRFVLLAWIGGLVHSVGDGSDAGQWWFIALLVVTAAPVLVALAARMGAAWPREGLRWRARGRATRPAPAWSGAPPGRRL